VKEGIPQVLQTFWSGTDHYVLMAGPGRQFPNESPVRGSRFSREGRNHGEPEPWASKPAKLLRTPRLHAAREHILSHIASLIQRVLMIGWKTTIVKSIILSPTVPKLVVLHSG
jgi:hypothetical protein